MAEENALLLRRIKELETELNKAALAAVKPREPTGSEPPSVQLRQQLETEKERCKILEETKLEAQRQSFAKDRELETIKNENQALTEQVRHLREDITALKATSLRDQEQAVKALKEKEATGKDPSLGDKVLSLEQAQEGFRQQGLALKAEIERLEKLNKGLKEKVSESEKQISEQAAVLDYFHEETKKFGTFMATEEQYSAPKTPLRPSAFLDTFSQNYLLPNVDRTPYFRRTGGAEETEEGVLRQEEELKIALEHNQFLKESVQELNVTNASQKEQFDLLTIQSNLWYKKVSFFLFLFFSSFPFPFPFPFKGSSNSPP